ncbi:hypothetical protein SAMN05428952_1003104 [Nitrosomonas sp. Nm132]|nr:hypothetical protein SAMN05428952_1003104 [Nitrosomonas sp. Nm132]
MAGNIEISQVPVKELLHVLRVSDCARSNTHSPITFAFILSSASLNSINTSIHLLSQLHTWPMVTPVNTSRLPSQATVHDSGPKRLAKPYSVRDFHPLFFASFAWRIKRPTLPSKGIDAISISSNIFRRIIDSITDAAAKTCRNLAGK